MNYTQFLGITISEVDVHLIETLAAIGTIVSLIVGSIIGYFRYKPKSNYSTLLEYLDSKTNVIVQKNEHVISWGWGKIFCLSKIHLQQISEKTGYRITYKPFSSYEKPLSKLYYDDHVKNKQMILSLITRCLLGKGFVIKEIKKIFIMTFLPNEIDYATSITVSPQHNLIEINNENTIEIRNYRIDLPIGTTTDKLTTSIKEIQEIHVDDGKPVGLTIKSIPPSDGHNPGKVIIVL